MAMNSQIQIICPSEAKIMLANNIINRRVRKNHVTYLANLIKNNHYKTTHQGIAISKSGQLLDGQHRLLACIQANKPIKILVTYGLEDDSFIAMDCGVARSMSDRTFIEMRTAEVTRYLLRVTTSNDLAKNAEVNIVLANNGIAKAHKELHDFCSTTRKTFSSTPMRSAVCLMYILGHDKDYIFSIYKDLVLLNFNNFSPVMFSFYKQYVEEKAVNFDTKFYVKAIKTLNHKNQNIKRIMVGDTDTQEIITLTKKTIKSLINLSE